MTKISLRTVSLFLVVLLLLCLYSDLGAQIGEGGSRSGAAGNVPAPLPDTMRNGVQLLASARGDSIVLRWGPMTPAAWLDGNRFGYVIERGSDEALENNGLPMRLTPDPLLPWSRQTWLERIGKDTTRKWMLIAQHVLFTSTSPSEMGAADGSVGALVMGAQELDNRHGLALFAADNDQEAATGLALRFVDRNVVPGRNYRYRVYINGFDTTLARPHDTAYTANISLGDTTAGRTPYGIAATGLDGAIRIEWEENEYASFSGYWVERRQADGRWLRLHQSPVVFIGAEPEPVGVLMPSEDGLRVASWQKPTRTISFVDSGVVNYRRHLYRVRGRDAFGELSPPAEIVAMARDLTPPPAPSLAAKEGKQGEILLSWKITESPGDLAGFRVWRASGPDGPFDSIGDALLPRTARSWLVADATEQEAYYRVAAVDTAGNQAMSITALGEVIDRIPPSAPEGLAGVVDTNGRITITWKRNPEIDVTGYRIHFSNDSTASFALLNGDITADTVFIDTLRIQTASNHVFYRVSAEDGRKNQSSPSQILTVTQPDQIPPNARVFEMHVATDSSVILRWNRGMAIDVVTQTMLRRDAGGGQWKELVRLPASAVTWEDTSVVPGQMYNYTLYAVDDAGLYSDSARSLYAGAYDLSVPAGVGSLVARLDTSSEAIRLRWEYTPVADDPVRRFVVYRGGFTGPMQRYQVVDPQQRTFLDAAINNEPVWKYAVRVETASGESPLSDGVIVVMNGS